MLHATDNSILGDINLDGLINIVDVAQMVNFVLTDNFQSQADMYYDGIINILDIVQLIGIILGN